MSYRPRHMAIRTLLRAKQRNKCCYCGVTMTRPRNRAIASSMTLEHLKRQVEGGKTTPDNVALACHECNSGRGAMDWLTYASYRRGELAA